MLHRNGTPPVTHPFEQAAVLPRTQFPPERPIDSSRGLIYLLSRAQITGLPPIRWLYSLLAAAALLSPLWSAQGMWWSLIACVLLGALRLWQWTARRRSYVRFTPRTVPPPQPAPLGPSAKLPVYVSGLLAVENKVRCFGGLPGFYRTFATREHALLCRARPRRLAGVAAWPAEEEGLWYAFFAAAHIHAIRPGEIAFDRRPLPGFALDYTPTPPLGGKKRRRPQRLTLYIAFAEQADFHAALADLAMEQLAANHT